jgi:hypothetical protein
MKMDFNKEHFENDLSSIRISFDPLSNINEESERQSEKQLGPKISTDAGIQIERIDDFNNEDASCSILVIFDEDANLNSPDDERIQSDRDIGRSKWSIFESRRSLPKVNFKGAHSSRGSASKHESPVEPPVALSFWLCCFVEIQSANRSRFIVPRQSFPPREVILFKIGRGLGPDMNISVFGLFVSITNGVFHLLLLSYRNSICEPPSVKCLFRLDSGNRD